MNLIGVQRVVGANPCESGLIHARSKAMLRRTIVHSNARRAIHTIANKTANLPVFFKQALLIYY